jgi:hypothetical protein
VRAIRALRGEGRADRSRATAQMLDWFKQACGPISAPAFRHPPQRGRGSTSATPPRQEAAVRSDTAGEVIPTIRLTSPPRTRAPPSGRSRAGEIRHVVRARHHSATASPANPFVDLCPAG